MGASIGGDKVNMERRSLLRFSVRFQVTSINGEHSVDTFIVDISPLGAKMEAPAIMSSLDKVELEFLIPGEARKNRIVGEVMWLEKEPESFGICIMGISFLKPQWEFMRFGHR